MHRAKIFGSQYIETWVEHGHVVRRTRSLDEPLIMRQNERIRAAGSARKGEFRPVLRMSTDQYKHLQRLYPELRLGDQAERVARWEKISRDPEFRLLWVDDGRF